MDNNTILDPEVEMLVRNKESAYTYRKRREDQWNENYLLYRGNVKVNRLTQRQSVTLPLMKQTIRTILKDIDDMPLIYFENLDNDKDKEILQNEYWEWTISPECNNMEIKDVVDKKQELLFGRSFDQMQIADGRILMTIEDPQDILVDRYTDPSDLDTARFLIHTNIFVPLSVLETRKEYDQEAIKRLKMWFATNEGIVKINSNQDMAQKKKEKMAELGLEDVDSPILSETYVELALHFMYHKEEGHEEQLYLYVEAENREKLMKKPLEEIVGITKDHYWRNHFPYNSWADDVERQDFWSDGPGDIVRPSAKIVNVWFSQLVENRTMRSFGMNYFDSTVEGFTPPNIEPEPWGWIGVPGKPQEVFQKVDIPDLTESLDEMNFVIAMNDRATGATATQQGVPTEKQITLGEIKLALTEAKERTKGISKYYTIVWKKRAEKFLKFIEAAPEKLDMVNISKKGRNSNDIYTRDIKPGDWMTKKGYSVKIWTQNDKNSEDLQGLQKIMALRTLFPNNPKLEEIVQRKALEFGQLNPQEINDVLRLENERRTQGINNPIPNIPPPANTNMNLPSPTVQ